MGAAEDRNKKYEFYISKLEEIPALPSIVSDLIKIVDDPLTSTKQIEDLLSRDQGLSLKTLRMANSAYYAIPGGCSTLSRAITFLGCNTLKQLVVSAAVADAFKKLQGSPFNIKEFWKHSAGTAIVAQTLSNHLDSSLGEESFVSGLLHDIGKLVILLVDKPTIDEMVKIAKEKPLTFTQIENEYSMPSHTYWGQFLVKKWQLPAQLQAVVKDHHTPRPSLRSALDAETNFLVDVVMIANQLVQAIKFGNSGYTVTPKLEIEVINRLGLSLEDKEAWFSKVKESLKHAEQFASLLFE